MNQLAAFPDIVPPAERERWHEMLKISHLVIVLLFVRMRAPRPVTALELSETLLIDRKSAGKYLHQLSTRSFILQVSDREGYTIADGGNSMLEMWGNIGHFSLKESFKDIKDSKTLKKERMNDVGTFWTLAQGLSVEQILVETGRLFEKEVTPFGLAACKPLMVLAVLAHAYDQRDSLRSPVAFAYRRLQRGQNPDKKYLTDPERYLPNDFLHALGLAELEVVEDVEVSDVGNDEPVSEAELLLQDLAERSQQISAVCVSWKPISFENGVLQLGVKSDEWRQRFQQKFSGLINDLLVQICDAATRVEFVAVETGGA